MYKFPPLPRPSGYDVLGVYLPTLEYTGNGVVMTLAYDASSVHGFSWQCDVQAGDRPIFLFFLRGQLIGSSFLVNSNANFGFTSVATTKGSRFNISYMNDLIFRSDLSDIGSDLNQDLIRGGMSLGCNDGGSDISLTVSNAVFGQYFPSAAQTNPAGNGKRKFLSYDHISIQRGNDAGIFSFDGDDGAIKLAKDLNSLSTQLRDYILTLDNDGTTETLGITNASFGLTAPSLVNHSVGVEVIFTIGTRITPIKFTNNGGGFLTQCSNSSPSHLTNAGLSITITADKNTCQITGRPISLIDPGTTHTIMAVNAVGSSSATIIAGSR